MCKYKEFQFIQVVLVARMLSILFNKVQIDLLQFITIFILRFDLQMDRLIILLSHLVLVIGSTETSIHQLFANVQNVSELKYALEDPLSDDFIESINKMSTTWKVSQLIPFFFYKVTILIDKNQKST